jgi:ribosome-binding factor A
MARHSVASQRAKRLAELIQRELSMILFHAHSDLRTPGPTITEVEVTRDLGFATVWITQFDADGKLIEQQLNNRIGEWRKALAPALATIHKMPKLHFKYDSRIEDAARIQQAITNAIAQTTQSEALQTQSDDIQHS